MNKFKAGDRVRVIDDREGSGGFDGRYFKIGNVGTVLSTHTGLFVQFDPPVVRDDGRWWVEEDALELVEEA